ncbi:MAG: YfcC family protein [Gemmatimonadota bacterium]|nr:YfcC family protein [Gemmatimonadota bacterium]MDH5760664.1 YfcC family protein [Gemmatimonadota bacterium]
MLDRLRLPHPLVLLTGCVLIAAAASYVLPAGEYDRAVDEATGREVVVAGTYHEVEPAPVGFFAAFVALPRGMAAAADVVFLVFLIGGAFTVVDETGALVRAVGSLSRLLHGRDLLVIPVVSLFFAAGGALENMQEEIIALVPVLLILTLRMGFAPMVAVAMSAGPAFVASSFSPINPFQVQIAQKVADVQLSSGAAFRTTFLFIALVLWIGGTMRYAAATRTAPAAPPEGEEGAVLGAMDRAILVTVALTFVVLVWGLLSRGWGFDELSALFFIMGIVVGAMAGMGIGGTAEAYVKGFRSMAYAALLIGFARAISVVLEDGRVIDTLVHALVTPLERLPVAVSALGMVVAQTAIHIPVPSVSGQAVLTMPILAPLSDLLGMSRQITVLAYQYGAGLCDLVTPTNGALMAILASAGVRFEEWIRFTLPLYLGLLALGAASILIGLAIGLT